MRGSGKAALVGVVDVIGGGDREVLWPARWSQQLLVQLEWNFQRILRLVATGAGPDVTFLRSGLSVGCGGLGGGFFFLSDIHCPMQ
mmetsp:Transcript_83971/g.224648  ORF Transcript_83971/g.224648 Transcript_83971/m.224648 type:complete len:86 (+) Transcript_83971:762-1019(+)